MKKKQKEMYDDYKRNPVRSILKEKKARRRRKRIKALLVIFVLVLIASFFASDYSRIKSIDVTGNELIDTQEIIKASDVKIHQSFTFFINDKKIASNIKKLPFVKSVDVSKDLSGKVSIQVVENDPIGQCTINDVLYLIDEKGKIAIDDQRKLINYVQRCPKMNNFNEKVLKKFAKEYAKIPYSVISQISSINYAPQNADETRCEFIMDDGKILYLRYDQMANQLKGNYYALLMEKYPDDKYYDFLGKYVYRSK